MMSAALGRCLAVVAGIVAATIPVTPVAIAAPAPVNVKDFGARGDGRADDTRALQAALDASPVVYCPPGTYLFSSTLVLHDYTLLYGDAPESTITVLAYQGTSGTALSAVGRTRLTIKNLQLTGLGRLGTGIDATNLVWYLHLEGLTVAGFNTAIKLKTNQQVRINQCSFNGNTDSISAQNVNTIQIVESSFFENYGTAITVGGAAGPVHGIAIRDSSVEVNGGYPGAVGISIVNGRAVAIDNVYFEIDQKSGPAIQIPTGALMAKSIGIHNSYVCAGLARYAVVVDRSDATVTFSTNSITSLEGGTGAAIQNKSVGSLVLLNNEVNFTGGTAAPVVDSFFNTSQPGR
jgi:hypothetical protein